MVMASLAGDSLALGAHWIYDVDEIERRFGRVTTLMKPSLDSYHPTKDAGDFTHYGDQTMALLESVAEFGSFDLEDFSRRWRKLFSDYRGYFDHATKGTLQGFEHGKGPSESGSHSTDLAGAARIAPLVYRYRNDLPSLISAVKSQTAMTHNAPAVIQSAELLARVTHAVLAGSAPVQAMKAVADELFKGEPVASAVHEGLESLGLSAKEAILDLGQSCNVKAALPAVVYLIARYETDLKEALVQNTMAGGDSAARGMVVGMVLGAHRGMEAIPGDWLAAMRASQRIRDLLTRIEESPRGS
jgi:ADP-ribosylglycohydrolase